MCEDWPSLGLVQNIKTVGQRFPGSAILNLFSKTDIESDLIRSETAGSAYNEEPNVVSGPANGH